MLTGFGSRFVAPAHVRPPTAVARSPGIGHSLIAYLFQVIQKGLRSLLRQIARHHPCSRTHPTLLPKNYPFSGFTLQFEWQINVEICQPYKEVPDDETRKWKSNDG